MRNFLTICLLFLTGIFAGCSKGGNPAPPVVPPTTTTGPSVDLWLSKADGSVQFKKQTSSLAFGTTSTSSVIIPVDSTQKFQSIDGFGYTLTGGSAYLINQLTPANRTALLKELFLTDDTGIGVSYLRLSMGASDLSTRVFSYDDSGTVASPDTNLVHFDLSTDKDDLVPLLKEIVALAPNIKLLATPWSAPLWMKDNDSSVGGTLQSKYYAAYAQYFVKYIQAMKAQGITIDAVTPQNEPENPYNNPSMTLTAGQEADFVKNHLGPAFQAASITTKIIAFDHNCDHPNYPETVLGDAGANSFIDGSAFHLYAGTIDALSQVHNAFPTKNVYFTEQYVAGPSSFAGDMGWHVTNLIVGATRNWSRNVLEWNLASDPNYYPHTAGGCGNCLGALTIGPSVVRNTSYYIIAHASKFVRPGSVRIFSNTLSTLPNVAFVNPDGKKVLIVLNSATSAQTFSIQYKGQYAQTSLDAGAVGTFVW